MKRAHKFFRFKETSDRSVREDCLRTRSERAVLVGEEGAVLVREDEAWSNRIHPYSLAELERKLRTKVFCPVNDSCLCNSISGDAGERTSSRL